MSQPCEPVLDGTRATAPPARLGADAVRRVSSAINLATRAYPGPVGELLRRELRVWLEFGYRIGSHGLVMAIVDDVLARAEAKEAA